MATSNIPFGLFFPDSDPADFLWLNAKKQGKPRDPLIQQLFPVNKHKRAATALRYEMSADHGLAKTRRRRQDAEIVLENFVDGLLLRFSQCSMERIR